MEREVEEKKDYSERIAKVKAQLAAAGYEHREGNRYSRIERNGKEYEVCLDAYGQIWTY